MMRRLIPTFAAILLMSVLALAQTAAAPAPTKPMPAQAASANTMSQQSDMQATMSRIAADKTLRMEMVHQLITVAHTDAAFRHEMAGAMMADKDMHMAMSHMQQGEKTTMKHEGMMGNKPAEKEPAPAKSTAPTPMPGK